MLKKRIIPCLDVKDGRTVKGIQFEGLRDAGDPVALAASYARQGADELVFLDITATHENRATLVELVKAVAAEIHIPFTVGGGISSAEQVGALLNAGADKVSLNSAAVRRPELITEIASRYGAQCVVVAIDARKEADGRWMVYLNGGRIATELEAIEWAHEAASRGAGEILLTSMNNDGEKGGFALDITGKMAREISIPLIASGGAGASQHFADLFTQTQAAAGLAASIFHYGELSIPQLKQDLSTQGIDVRI